jgi:hypothetical protein
MLLEMEGSESTSSSSRSEENERGTSGMTKDDAADALIGSDEDMLDMVRGRLRRAGEGGSRCGGLLGVGSGGRSD